ncbi:MAG: hypothetical protein Q4G43_16625, partial [Mobilicoccus sp.]|nr:hypothetical protein [Mobilicoccus sp.]
MSESVREDEHTGAEAGSVTSAVSQLSTGRPRAANGRFLPVDATPDPDALPDDRFLDRELSWLQFNERVL